LEAYYRSTASDPDSAVEALAEIVEKNEWEQSRCIPCQEKYAICCFLPFFLFF